jgi:hypothetical protein
VQRNIVPLMFDNSDFSNPNIANQLTGKMAALKRYNALPSLPRILAKAMDRTPSPQLPLRSSVAINAVVAN